MVRGKYTNTIRLHYSYYDTNIVANNNSIKEYNYDLMNFLKYIKIHPM